MKFGIHTLEDFNVKGKTVLCRVDMNQPVDKATDSLKSIQRIVACAPTVRELSDKGAKNADVNLDKKVDGTDSLFILKSLVSLVTLPVKE